MTTLAVAAQGRHNNLDFLRFVLASMVVFTHSFNVLYGDNTDPLGVASGGRIGLGGAAVDFFFLISGYLITASWQQSSGLVDYLRKRILRIYPAFVAAAMLCAFMIGPLAAADTWIYLDQLDLAKFFSGIPDLRLNGMPETFRGNALPNMVNAPLWTVRYEFICYLGLAVLGKSGLLSRRYPVVLLLLVMLAVLTVRAMATEPVSAGGKDILGVWPRFLSCFLAGASFRLYREHIPYSLALFLVALASLVTLIVANLTALAIPLFGSYCIFFLAFNARLGLTNFGKYGDFSYGIYLYAFPLQQLTAMHFANLLNGLSMFVVSMIVAVACAALSWHLLEKPCLQLKKRGNRRIEVDVAAS